VCDGNIPKAFPGAFGGTLSSGILSQRALGGIQNDIELSQAEAEAIKNGSKSLYLFGIAVYEDVLKGQHQTKWSLMFQTDASRFSYASDHDEMA
jgi:hypothetical protein